MKYPCRTDAGTFLLRCVATRCDAPCRPLIPHVPWRSPACERRGRDRHHARRNPHAPSRNQGTAV